jgi:hypothetical protein
MKRSGVRCGTLVAACSDPRFEIGVMRWVEASRFNKNRFSGSERENRR